MKNDTTFVRMRSCDHLGDVKMSKRGTSGNISTGQSWPRILYKQASLRVEQNYKEVKFKLD